MSLAKRIEKDSVLLAGDTRSRSRSIPSHWRATVKNFKFEMYSNVDICAALHEGLKVCGSLRVSRERWARLIEAEGFVDFKFFNYLRRKDGEKQPSLEEAASSVIAEAFIEGWDKPATVNIIHSGCVIFTTPNGVQVSISSELQFVEVKVDFNRDSAFLATMMLAGFARRAREARELLAIAAAELAAQDK